MKRILLVIIGLCFNGAATAATVWAPTNTSGDVNVILTMYYTGSGVLGLFDDANQSYTSPGLLLGNNDTVTFSQSSTGYTAKSSNSGNTVALSDTYNFIFGMSTDNGATWTSDTFAIELTGGNAYQIFFGDIGQTVVADVRVVPLPAAFWLFSSALLGLFGFSRHRGALNSN